MYEKLAENRKVNIITILFFPILSLIACFIFGMKDGHVIRNIYLQNSRWNDVCIIE